MTAKGPASLTIHLFGRFNIIWGGRGPVSQFPAKAQELLAYVLTHQSQSHTREKIMGLLWRDASSRRARQYLRKALWNIQRHLTPPLGSETEKIIIVEPNWIRANLAANLAVDIDRFEKAYLPVKGIQGKEMSDEMFRDIQEGVKWYGGPFLEGCYSDWCILERERLREIYLIMLDKLIGYCEASQKYELGIIYGLQTIGLDMARERSHRQLMRLFSLSGDRTAAIRQYERCREVLQDELGVKPSAATDALLSQIQSDHQPYTSNEISQGAAIIGKNEQIQGSLLRLRELFLAVESIQRRMPAELSRLEDIIKSQ